MNRLFVQSDYCHILNKCPLLFLKRCAYKQWISSIGKERGHYEENVYWTSSNSSVDCNIEEDQLDKDIAKRPYILVHVMPSTRQIQSNKQDRQSYDIEPFNPGNSLHVKYIFDSCFLRNDIPDECNKYACTYLLWSLFYERIISNVFVDVLSSYPSDHQTYLLNIIKNISVCLPVNKQHYLNHILGNFGFQLEIYCPHTICEPYQDLFPSSDNTKYIDIFYAIDKMFALHRVETDLDKTYYDLDPLSDDIYERHKNNALIKIHNWLCSDDYRMDNYEGIAIWFAFFNQIVKLLIIKRYFYDIKLQRTKYDENLLCGLFKNKYKRFSIYRHCLKRPDDAIILTAEFLSNSIVVFKHTKGVQFQGLNDMLDFIMTNCDISNPSILLGIEHFFPICQGGAVINKDHFSGFIKLYDEYVLDETLLSSQKLYDIIPLIFSCYKNESSSNDSNKVNTSDKENNIDKGSINLYDKEWKISCSSPDIPILSEFVNLQHDINDPDYVWWSISQVSFSRLSMLLVTFGDRFGSEYHGGYTFNQLSPLCENILLNFFIKSLVKINVRNDIVLSHEFNLYHLRDTTKKNERAQHEDNDEKKRVYNQIFRLIDNMPGVQNIEDKYFEIERKNTGLITGIMKMCYYNESNIGPNDNIFLTSCMKGKYPRFCRPLINKEVHATLDLPFLWCNNTECFYNDYFLPANAVSWKEYDLLNMIEILGYPPTIRKGALVEPVKSLKNFVSISAKAQQKFKSLKCKGCGHLIFVDNERSFNQHIDYSCKNPNCNEYRNNVYLSYCYHCKKALIDSRDTTKCPNGMYICPSCLSCCNDEVFSKIYQKYIVSQIPYIPRMIIDNLGHGHNDKGEYFCPKCGKQLKSISKSDFRCDVCDKTFHIEK